LQIQYNLNLVDMRHCLQLWQLLHLHMDLENSRITGKTNIKVNDIKLANILEAKNLPYFPRTCNIKDKQQKRK